MFDFIVLGATGMQGRIASRDLLKNGYSVLLCGRDKSKVEKLLKGYKKSEFEFVDLRDHNHTLSVLKISGAPVVLNCAEGDFNVSAMKAALKAGIHYLDLGSEPGMTREQLGLNDAFKKKSLLALTGCGSAPGVVSVMARYADQFFDTVDSVHAGFAWNSNMPVFVVPFSIDTVLEEFVEKAPIFQEGRYVRKHPYDCKLEMEYKEIGKQKTQYAEHPEIITFPRYFQSKGVRNVSFFSSFPDHSRTVIEMLLNLGFASHNPLTVGDHDVSPVSFLTASLKNLKIPKGYTEKENLWVHITGKKNGLAKEVRMDCVARTLKGWEDATCNIDTGMPASIMAQMVKNGVIPDRGVFSPEFVVPHEPLFKELAKRKMYVYEDGKRIN